MYFRSPIALGYTRGHFCALVPPEPDPGCGGGAGGGAAPPPAPQCCYLPLVGRDLAPLPLHFLARSELGREEELLKQWLDIGITESGRSSCTAVSRAIVNRLIGRLLTYFAFSSLLLLFLFIQMTSINLPLYFSVCFLLRLLFDSDLLSR